MKEIKRGGGVIRAIRQVKREETKGKKRMAKCEVGSSIIYLFVVPSTMAVTQATIFVTSKVGLINQNI